ncbi:unnamed protein product [Adineta steineri]|uniref:Uncharacterized protein n=1 Tax=Adineta steineri TaxID=433720 RepID=A0A814M292_9BILA|nr:unnamed protein product [Adineta steineri]CAF1241137.1 unnamed protein product [Adineta steineri]CAF1285631.1 unnamed protein product [Adineta steineri]CAF3517767.1 unnamed protein product [Adineta steineri]CAF3527618.1 unnamed protein product [Adineta steineri]
MESPSHFTSEMNQSPPQVTSSNPGYITPPRSNPSLSQHFHQPKLLTSAELKRRFSPIHSSNKKRRHNLIRKYDCIVPYERDVNRPIILQKLYDNKNQLSPTLVDQNDYIIPITYLNSSSISSKLIHPRPSHDCLMSNSCKIEQENFFPISETVMKERFKILLQKK